MLGRQQDGRTLSHHPWRERIDEFVFHRANVTTYEILREALDILDAKMTRSDQTQACGRSLLAGPVRLSIRRRFTTTGWRRWTFAGLTHGCLALR